MPPLALGVRGRGLTWPTAAGVVSVILMCVRVLVRGLEPGVLSEGDLDGGVLSAVGVDAALESDDEFLYVVRRMSGKVVVVVTVVCCKADRE